MSKLDAYELIFKDMGGETPRLTGTGKKISTPKVEQQIVIGDVKGTNDTPDVKSTDIDTDEPTLEKIYLDYIAKGYGKMKAMELAKSDMREFRKKEREKEREKAREDAKNRKQENKKEREKAREDEKNRVLEEKKKKKEEKEAGQQVTRERNLAKLAGDVDDPDDGGDKSWLEYISVNEDNVPYYKYMNVYNFIKHFPLYAGRISKNLFTYDYELDGERMTDETYAHIRHVVNERLGNMRDKWVEDAVTVTACANPHHPVMDIIESLEWDGTPRAETFFIDRLGAEDTPLTREITAKWLYAMIERMYDPGCMFDHYLIISDTQQGTGKTKTMLRLTECLRAKVDFPLTPIIRDITNDQNNVLMLQRSIIGLFDEAEGMKYANLERFKSFVTTSKFTARLPYQSKPSVLNIHSVFAVVTNDDVFLTDGAGYERRAWVLSCHGTPDAGQDYWEPRNNDDTLRQVWAELRHWRLHPESAPYEMTLNKFNFISSMSKRDLVELQMSKKTSTLDVDLYNTVSSIFTNTYSKSMFTNERDFLSDFRHSKRGKDEEDYDVELDVIPCDWVVSVSQKSVTGKRGTETVKNMVGKVLSDGSVGKWVLDKKYSYGGKTMPCWVKVNVKSGDGKKEQIGNKGFFDVTNIPD